MEPKIWGAEFPKASQLLAHPPLKPGTVDPELHLHALAPGAKPPAFAVSLSSLLLPDSSSTCPSLHREIPLPHFFPVFIEEDTCLVPQAS